LSSAVFPHPGEPAIRYPKPPLQPGRNPIDTLSTDRLIDYLDDFPTEVTP
jgi:hypothetical protein